MSPDRVVVDTNVLISAALLTDSVPARLLRHLLRQGRLLFSPATFDELHTRLWRPKFDRYVTIEDRKLFLHDLQGVADWLDPLASADAPACRDPADQVFVDLAMAGRAAALVSGDRDLLDMRRVGDCPVLTPSSALARFAPRR